MKNQQILKRHTLKSYCLEIWIYQFDLTRDIIINVIQIDPSDVLLTDESDLLNLVKLEDIISRTEEIHGITLTEEQVLNLRMKDYIALILSHKQ